MNERTANLVSGLLGLSSLMCLVGAVVARQTGDEIFLPGGGSFRTHQDAFVVLLVLGIVLLVNTAVVAAQMPRDFQAHEDGAESS